MELNLDLSLDFVPKTIPEIFLEVSSITDTSLKRLKLDDYVKRLEDEMRKIDAFKRELPLCVLLIKDAILRLKDEIEQFQPVIEEFIPLKGNSDDEESEKKKKNKWLNSAQLWNTNFNFEKQNSKLIVNLNNEEEDRSVPENPIENWEFGKRRRAFELFNDESNFTRNEMKEDNEISQVPKLTLMTPISDPFSTNLNNKGGGGSGDGIVVPELSTMAAEMKGQNKLSPQQQQTIRKQRRCWSPELHRRFVDALHRLGGSQVATPKQIRELMQVDGLTNDEVKSHLQKYRLHVRKLGPSEAEGKGSDIWMSQEHSKGTSITHACSPDGPLHVGGSAKALSITEGDSMEAEEDAKSDGHSWKGRIHKLR